MSTRDFNMVSPTVWRSGRFGKLEPPAKLLFLYLLTCEHQNSSGGFRLPAGYAAEDLGCTGDEFKRDMDAIVAADMALYDADTKEVFVRDWFQHCAPTNLKHAKGAMKIISRVSSDTIREVMETEIAASEWGGKAKVDNGAEVHPFDTPNDRLTGSSYMRGRLGR